jgi:AraC-like DNA-binding protein
MKWLPSLLILLSLSLSSYSQEKSGTNADGDTLDLDRIITLSKKAQWVDSYISLKYAHQALVKAQHLNDKERIAIAHNLKGFCFWTFGDNDLAIQSAMTALETVQQENLPSIQAESYYILARGYMDLRERKQAHEAIRKAEQLATAGTDWEQLCSIYNLKGVILFIDDKPDSALYYYKKAYDVGKEHNVDPINFPRIISNIGECYAPADPDKGLAHFNEALALAKKTGNTIAEASITDIIGHAYLKRKDYKTAETRLQESLKLAQTLGLRRVIRHSYAGLVDIKLDQGKGDEAVVYLRKYYAVRDSLLNTYKIRQIVELEAKHELKLKEQNIKLLESEAKIQSIRTNILIVAIVLLALFSIGVYFLQRYRHRKNREMLNLEIDYLIRQHKEAIDKYKNVITQESHESIESYDQKLLKKAIALVEEHMSDTQLSVEKMAEEMNMSRTSLHRKIKSITGFPPSELIRSIRLRKAAHLIVNRVDSVTQIALMVGFDDYSHFSKSFKKHFGVAPSGYEEHTRMQRQVEAELINASENE